MSSNEEATTSDSASREIEAPPPQTLLLLAGVVVVAGAVVAQSIWGFAALLLYFAASALLLTILLMWTSLQKMGEKGSMSFEEALSFAAPTVTEEQKRALLRTLKDLDYELHVGKISREDFDQISTDLRKKAKEIIALSDAQTSEQMNKAEARVEKFAAKKAATNNSPPENSSESVANEEDDQ